MLPQKGHNNNNHIFSQSIHKFIGFPGSHNISQYLNSLWKFALPCLPFPVLKHITPREVLQRIDIYWVLKSNIMLISFVYVLCEVLCSTSQQHVKLFLSLIHDSFPSLINSHLTRKRGNKNFISAANKYEKICLIVFIFMRFQ